MIGHLEPQVDSAPTLQAQPAPARWGGRARRALRRLAREPLVHFVVVGALLLVASAWFERSGLGGSEQRITISLARIGQMRATWAAQWGQPPNARELQTLIDDAVREEVFYREALTSGFDRDDAIIRRHLAQKVEFLAQSLTSAAEPADAALSAYFRQHVERYRLPPRVAFSHIYFSRSQRGAGAESAAMALLRDLHRDRARTADVQALGDGFMLQRDYPLQTPVEVRDQFGGEFAKRVFELPPGDWGGPIASSFGVHLVRVAQLMPSRLPTLDDVRDQVSLDFKDQQLRSAVDAYYQKARRRYRVIVEADSPGTPAP